jgi:hypothetical protein
MFRTNVNASWCPSHLNTVSAIVAFGRSIVVRIDIESVIWASLHA